MRSVGRARLGRLPGRIRVAKPANRLFSRFRSLISPITTLTLTWTLSLVVYIFITYTRGDFAYFEYLVILEHLVDSSSFFSYIVLLLNFVLFVVGARLASSSRPVGDAGGVTVGFTTLRPLVLITMVTAVIALAWIGGAILSVGGMARLAELAASDNMAAREAVRSASFPGGRLVSYGFIGISTIAATYIVHAQSRVQRLTLAAVIGVSLTYLALMPLLVSGRITFFVAVIGSYLAATLSAKKFVGFKYLILGIPLLIGVWSAKQYLTLGHIQAAQDESVGSQAFEGLLFYFYNDILNSLNAPEMLGNARMLGWYSLRFVFFMTFTDKIFQSFIVDSHDLVGRWLTAGEVPLLMAPFVDFWLFGSVLLVIFGYFCQRAYFKSYSSARWSAIYGSVFSGLLLSTHSAFLTSQELVYSMMLIYFVSAACERVPTPKGQRS